MRTVEKNILEIKSFDDAVRIVKEQAGEDCPLVKQYEDVIKHGIVLDPRTEAYMKLIIIAAAYNNLWTPDIMDDAGGYWIPMYVVKGDMDAIELGVEEEEINNPEVTYKASNGLEYFFGFSSETGFDCQEGGYNADDCPAFGLRTKFACDAAARLFSDIYIKYLFG
jgi:hypothetical protein